MNNVLKALLNDIMMHQSLMVQAHKAGLQGMKRFNRYESVENLHRINELKNYMTEFTDVTIDDSVERYDYNVTSYLDMMTMINNDRTDMVNLFEKEISETMDICYIEMLTKWLKDFKKEQEVFTRFINRYRLIKSPDDQLMYLYKWDDKMHEYIKHKED